MRFDKFRPGQLAAFGVVEDRIIRGESLTAVIIPTRYGKSDLARVIAMQLKHKGLIGGTVTLAPGIWLQSQMVSQPQILAMSERYELDYSQSRLVGMADPYTVKPFCNSEYLLSMTIQGATQSMDLMGIMAKSVRARTGRPLLVVIDECHQTSSAKKRGDLVAVLKQAGAHVMLMTATAVRADNEMIPGFEYELESEESVHRMEYYETDEGVRRVRELCGVSRTATLRAHHTTTFKDAWAESPSPLCLLDRQVIDVWLNDLQTGDPQVLLNKLSESEAQRYLTKATRHPRTIECGTRMLLNDILLRRRIGGKWAGIVFTGDDLDTYDQDNQHAREVESAIKMHCRDLGVKMRVVIATQKTDGDANEILRDFVEDEVGDILIVKQMCAAGLDSGRLKTMLDLSPVRTVASFIQRCMRVATPCGDMKTGTVITIADPKSDAIWAEHVVEEGGAAVVSVGSEFEVIDDKLAKEREPKPEKSLLQIGNVEFSSVIDNNGLSYKADQLSHAVAVLDVFPELKNHYTTPDVARLLGSLGGTIDTVNHDAGKTLDEEIKECKAAIYKATADIATRGGRYSKTNKALADAWSERRKDACAKAYKAAGCELSFKYKNCRDLQRLKRILQSLRGM